MADDTSFAHLTQSVEEIERSGTSVKRTVLDACNLNRRVRVAFIVALAVGLFVSCVRFTDREKIKKAQLAGRRYNVR